MGCFLCRSVFGFPAEEEIGRSCRNGQGIGNGDHQEWQLCVGAVEEAGHEGTDDAAKGLCGIIEAHDQILLNRICLDGNHVLQHGKADGIACVDQDAEGLRKDW